MIERRVVGGSFFVSSTMSPARESTSYKLPPHIKENFIRGSLGAIRKVESFIVPAPASVSAPPVLSPSVASRKETKLPPIEQRSSITREPKVVTTGIDSLPFWTGPGR